ncbi:MAG: glycosyltransferase family 39 protein [Candidatus Bathyarchaeota archaeon]|nr:glycosyltransferase family 39 protein [Candidatus Bathyarchaeota archaeon]
MIRPQLDDVYLLVMFMKVPQIVAECLISLLIYFVVREERSPNMGILAALIFLFTPFTFFLTAVWGAPESIVSLFVVASIYMVYKGSYLLAYCLLGASLMVKPYTIVFLPPIILFTYPNIGARKTLLKLLFFILSSFFVASPWLIVQREVFIDAMWSGALHNLGVRIPEGVIWGFPSFWLIINILCSISGFPYKVIAPLQLYVFIFLALLICFIIIRLRLNLKKENLWFISHLFLFCFMMFFPSAHEKWEYSCFPLLLVASFLIRKHSLLLLLTYFTLAFSLSGAVYGSGHYFFESTDVLPMPRRFIYGGFLAEGWYNFLWESVKIMGAIFPQGLSAFLLLGIFLLHLSILFSLSKFEKPAEKMAKSFPGSRQMLLDDFLKSSEEDKKMDSSINFEQSISKEVEEATRTFNLLLNDLQEIFLEIKEVENMFKSNEVSENTYRLIISSLGGEALKKIQDIYAIREKLDLIKARAKVEWAREKIELSRLLSLEGQRILEWDTHLRKSVYAPLNMWENVISIIEKSLSSLTIERELSIIEQTLFIIKKKHLSLPAEIIEGCRKICEQRLNAISKIWSSDRRSVIEKISSIEEKISQIKEEIREIEIRFAVGEFNRDTFEQMLSNLQGSLKSMEEDYSKMKNHLQEIDEKLFKCLEDIKEKDAN